MENIPPIGETATHDPTHVQETKTNKEPINAINPSSFTYTTTKRRVAGRLIESWEPLPSTKALDRMLDSCLYCVTEVLSKKPEAMSRASSFLFREWISPHNPHSFRSRFSATNVPPPKTLSPHCVDVFDVDELTRQKRILETVLSAEMRQLDELKRHRDDLRVFCEHDKKYLAQMRRTVDSERKDMRKRTESLANDKERVENKPKRRRTHFDPNKDEECVEILDTISRHLASLRESTDGLDELNDNLGVVMGVLENI